MGPKTNSVSKKVRNTKKNYNQTKVFSEKNMLKKNWVKKFGSQDNYDRKKYIYFPKKSSLKKFVILKNEVLK